MENSWYWILTVLGIATMFMTFKILRDGITKRSQLKDELHKVDRKTPDT